METGALQLAHGVSSAQMGVRGSVRITASQPVACLLLPPLLLRMRPALPDIQVELVASNDVTNLLRREADIALRMVRPDQSSLVARRIGTVTLGAYAHQDYLRSRGVQRQPTDLLTHELVGNDRYEYILRGFAAGGPYHHPRRNDAVEARVSAARGLGRFLGIRAPQSFVPQEGISHPDLSVFGDGGLGHGRQGVRVGVTAQHRIGVRVVPGVLGMRVSRLIGRKVAFILFSSVDFDRTAVSSMRERACIRTGGSPNG